MKKTLWYSRMNYQYILLVLIPLLIVCIPNYCWAFRKMPLSIDSARSLSMGRAFVSIADVENVVSYNPAGLGFNEKPELFLDTISQFNSWPDWTNYLDVQILAGLAYKNVGAGIAVRKRYFSGSYIENEIELISIITCGLKLNKWLSLGLRGKFNNIANDASTVININEGPSLDIGFIYMPTGILSMGLMCVDLLSFKGNYLIRDDYYNSRFAINENLPQNLDIGFSLKFPYNILISFDINNLIEYKINTSVVLGSFFYQIIACPPYEFKRSYHLGVKIPILNFLIIKAGGVYEKYPHDFNLISNGAYIYQDSYLVTCGIELKSDNIRLDASFGKEFKDIGISTWYLTLHGSWVLKDFISLI